LTGTWHQSKGWRRKPPSFLDQYMTPVKGMKEEGFFFLPTGPPPCGQGKNVDTPLFYFHGPNCIGNLCYWLFPEIDTKKQSKAACAAFPLLLHCNLKQKKKKMLRYTEVK
jgi:hypothetical protein